MKALRRLMSIWKELGNIYELYFSSDMDIISPKAKRILSNPEDRKKYMEAVKRLKENQDKADYNNKETVKLSNNEEITLVH